MKFDFAIPLQDCIGTSIRLTGIVENASNATIFIKGEDGLYRGESSTNLVLHTDADGRFDSGNRPLHVFMCEMLQITAAAEGFETQQLRYILLEHYSEDELIAFMRSQQPIPISLELELQEADDA